MLLKVAEQLSSINREFYRQFSTPFSESRTEPQPGFFKLLDYLPDSMGSVLDVGCGDGRFGRFLQAQEVQARYTGVDLNRELLALAQANLVGTFLVGDISQDGWEKELDRYNLIACFAVLQHIPLHTNRQRLMGEIASLLKPGGRIFLSTWQFLISQRQRQKIIPWELVGLTAADVEQDDYLISWQRGGKGMRYVNYLDIEGLENLARNAGLEVIYHFRSDGKEENLNLYAIMVHR